jgi:hypothetical protein
MQALSVLFERQALSPGEHQRQSYYFFSSCRGGLFSTYMATWRARVVAITRPPILLTHTGTKVRI